MDEPGPIDPADRDLRNLLADIANKEIDKSHWQSRREPVVNEFRARQPDVLVETDCPECGGTGMTGPKRCPRCGGNKRVVDDTWSQSGQVRYARLQVHNILNYLWEKDVLGDGHIWAARAYEIWHGVYAAARGARYSSCSIYGRGDGGLDGKEEKGFSLLLRRLPVKYHGLIQRSLPPASDHEKWVAWRDRHHFQEAFEKLIGAMDEIRSELENEDSQDPDAKLRIAVSKIRKQPAKQGEK